MNLIFPQKGPKLYFQSQFPVSKIDSIFSKKNHLEHQFRSPFFSNFNFWTTLKSCPIFDKLVLPIWQLVSEINCPLSLWYLRQHSRLSKTGSKVHAVNQYSNLTITYCFDAVVHLEISVSDRRCNFKSNLFKSNIPWTVLVVLTGLVRLNSI